MSGARVPVAAARASIAAACSAQSPFGSASTQTSTSGAAPALRTKGYVRVVFGGARAARAVCEAKGGNEGWGGDPLDASRNLPYLGGPNVRDAQPRIHRGPGVRHA